MSVRGRRVPWLPAGIAAAGAALALGLLALDMRERVASRAAFPALEGRLGVDGLAAPVEIHRDARGVPHIEAESERDAFFALGFVHAQDRLAQMLWMARSGRGRTAEVVGESGLASDRRARVLGLPQAAATALEALDAETRGLLESYAQGVNARIARVRAGRVAPPRVLGRWDVPLEDWTPLDTLVVWKLYAWGLSDSLDASLVLIDLIDHLGGFRARRFFPDVPNVGVPARRKAPPTTASALGPDAPDPLRRAVGLAGRATGSSAWVLGGAHSASGKPLLAADAHLEPTAPPVLHLDHVRGGGFEVVGTTLPGVPVFWAGANARVAWASTRAGVSTTDLYVETLHPREPDQYHDGRGWKPLALREETIGVRGADDELLVVRSTRHGPLVNALLAGEREPLSLSWVGQHVADARGIASLLDVARARDARALLAALEDHDEPALSIAYADTRGDAGVQLAGWVPARVIPSGLVPLPGRASYYDWKGPIPFESLPRDRLRNGRGWAIAADNRLPGADRPIDWLWRSGARTARIEQLLRASVRRGPVDVRGLARLQTDVGTERGPRLVTAALELASGSGRLGAESREVSDLLVGWDGRSQSSSAGAAAYHIFLEDLTRRLLAEPLGPALFARYLAVPQSEPDEVVFGILRDAATGAEMDDWTDRERIGAAVVASLRETWFQLSFELGANRRKWRWGRLHPLTFRTLPLAPPSRDGLGPYDYGGSTSTPNTAEYDPGAPFQVRVASTARFAVDTAELDQVLVSLAPGQSEHPDHPHFLDGVEGWLEGRPAIVATSRLLVEESSTSRLVLVPAP